MAMKLPTASCGVSPGFSSVVAFLSGCTQPQQAAGYWDKIKKLGDEAADLNKKAVEKLQIEESKDFLGQFYGSPLHDYVRDVEAAAGKAFVELAEKALKRWKKLLAPL